MVYQSEMKKYRISKKSIEFLSKLIDTPSPSGFEADVQQVYINYLKPFISNFDADVLGNVSAILNPDSDFKVMLAAHCDEIGLMVQYIDSNGFLVVNKIGGPNLSAFAGHKVLLRSNDGKWINGIIQRKANCFSLEQMNDAGNYYVDIGISSKEETLKVVSPGTPIVINRGIEKLSNTRYSSKAFDDKIGLFVIAETIRILSETDLDIGVYAVSTVQEEVGTRGAETASFSINPDIGITVDVNGVSDFPSATKKNVGEIELGGGAVLVKGVNVNSKVDEILTNSAKTEVIKTQVSPCPGITGTDARTIQLARNGVATGLVKIPLRYMHSPAEVLDMKDVEASIDLLVSSIVSLKADTNFCPIKLN